MLQGMDQNRAFHEAPLPLFTPAAGPAPAGDEALPAGTAFPARGNPPSYIADHRARLRDRFMQGGAGAMPDYELLELVLFRAILRYNNSSSYALAVGLLSQRFNGGGTILADWPKDDRPLSRSERVELQMLLSQRNYDAGNADGIIGANTRKAIRSAQQAMGWPADGYPSHKLLESLRSR